MHLELKLQVRQQCGTLPCLSPCPCINALPHMVPCIFCLVAWAHACVCVWACISLSPLHIHTRTHTHTHAHTHTHTHAHAHTRTHPYAPTQTHPSKRTQANAITNLGSALARNSCQKWVHNLKAEVFQGLIQGQRRSHAGLRRVRERGIHANSVSDILLDKAGWIWHACFRVLFKRAHIFDVCAEPNLWLWAHAFASCSAVATQHARALVMPGLCSCLG